MTIKLNLDHVMLDRRVSLTDLADRIGITLANLSILKTNKARAIRFSTLEALCRALDCQPGDLIEFVPATDGAAASDDGSKSGSTSPKSPSFKLIPLPPPPVKIRISWPWSPAN